MTTQEVTVSRVTPLMEAIEETHEWAGHPLGGTCRGCGADSDSGEGCKKFCPKVVEALRGARQGMFDESKTAVSTLALAALRACFSGDEAAPGVIKHVGALIDDAWYGDGRLYWALGYPARRAKKTQDDLTYCGMAVHARGCNEQDYRYLLARCWEPGKLVMVFDMLNPSKAGAAAEDNTIRRCRGFAEREGCGGFVVVNTRARVETDPSELGGMDDVGPLNGAFVDAAMQFAREGDLRGHRFPFVAAWGGNAAPGDPLVVEALQRAKWHELEVLCLGMCANGSPKHPLRLAKDTPLVGYAP